MEPDEPITQAKLGPLEQKPFASWRNRLHEIIFESDTLAGKAFDVGLLLVILLSVIVVMLESVVSIRQSHGKLLYGLEWAFTGLFTLEYALRIVCVQRPWRYVFSFYGLIDLLAVVPTYLSLFVSGAQTLLIIRVIRLLRVFLVFKLARFLGEGLQLAVALKASRHKIVVFLSVVLAAVCVMGTLMFLLEGPENGFTSIPQSVYWAIVTMTTVGYGDIAPKTVAGQLFASVVMVMGYGIIAVPTGIVSVELAKAARKVSTQVCQSCLAGGHEADARYCRHCGTKL